MVTQLVEQARTHRATFRLVGGEVQVAAPVPLPPELMAELRENKDRIAAHFTDLGRCLACTCDSAIPRLHPRCPLCKSMTCAQCGQCTAYLRGWDPGWTEPNMLDQPLAQLLHRLREGHQWLCRETEKFHNDVPESATDALFGKMLAVWDDMEVAVRHVHEYRGYVLGEGQQCPMDAPVRCSACVSISTDDLGT